MTETLDQATLRAELLRRRLRGTAAPVRDESIARVSRDTPPRPSSAQRRLWILDQLQPGTTEYLMSTALRLRGPVDRAAVRVALDGIVARHEVLRTRYEVVDGEPVQVIDAPSAAALSEVDLSGEVERLAGLMTSDRAPIDLAVGPVFGATLARMDEQEWALVFTAHHIASDAWSEELVVREFATRYNAAVSGESLALPPHPVQYADYAAWQHDQLTADVVDRQLAYWRGKLAGLTPLELPADRPRPKVRDAAGDQVTFDVPAGVAHALSALARANGATPFMTLLAAFKILLARYARQDDVAVGTPVAGRERVEFQDMLGLFLNTLVLRTDLSGDPSFTEVLGRVRDTVLDAYGHQRLPFERLVEDLVPDRDPSRTPLFSAMFLWQESGSAGVELADLRAESIPVGESTAKFDLTLAVTERADGSFAGGINFATALFDRATVERLAGHFVRLLAGVAATPEAPVGRMELLAEAEHAQLAAWNATDVDYPTGTLTGLFEARVEQCPDAVAVRFEDAELSYRDLDARAGRLASHLRTLGVGPESVVAVGLDRGIDLVVSLLAILKAGGAYLPLDPDYPADRLAYMLADSGATLVISDRDHGIRTVDPRMDLPEAAGDAVEVHPAHPAYVIYTSGSTGRPKGVMVEHRAIVNRLLWMQDAYGLDGSDRVLQKTPYSFDVSVWEFFWPLITGATLVMARPGGHRDPAYLAEVISEAGITTLHFVPSMLRAFLAEPFGALPSVRRVICSGEALPADLVTGAHERIGGELHNLYGPTEAAVDVTATLCVPGEPVTIGRPIANTRTHIVDAHGSPVPVGVPGELLLAGVQLARGYLNKPALTAERFVPGPGGERRYRTGDLARFRPDGAIDYLGRIDHQVKVRGHRIELGEIESVLAEHPEVGASAVTVHDGQLVGYPVGSADVRELAKFLRERLPESMIPTHWVALDTLPLTTSGKVDRKALPKPAAGSALTGEYTAPRTPLERSVAEAMAEAIGVERIGVHDRFFDAGGDSIRAIRAVGALRAQGIDVSVQHVFTHPSPAELASVAGETVADELVGRFELLAEVDRKRLPDGLADAYPMGQVQAGMVYEMIASPHGNSYQNVTNFQIVDDGPFSLDAVREAVRLLVDRHEILRTSFDLTGYTEPMQLVHETADLPVGYDDLRGLSEEDQKAAVQAYLAEAKLLPFDLSQAPLLRYHVHQLGEREWLLTHIECHAILDGWSHHSLIGELRACYKSLRDGKGSGLGPKPPARYADFIALEKKSLASVEDREFWRDRLERFDRLRLPEDSAPPAERDEHFEVRLPWRDLEPGLRRIAAQTQTSLKTVLYTAHLKVLGLITGQRRFFAGAVTNGRPETLDGDQVRGMYLNTVPFAVDLSVPSWRELLRGVFAEEMALWPHRRYPVPAMQREWGGGAPLIDVIFAALDFHVLDDHKSGVGEIVDDSPNEFTLDVWTFPGELRVTCRPGWAGRERLTGLAGAYLAVLTEMAADLDADPRAFRAPSLEQQTGQPRVSPPLPPVTVTDLVAAQVRARPDEVAVEFRERRMTYAQLDRRANQLARLLRANGVGVETPVAVCMDRGVEVVVALLGILKAGGCYVPIDPAHPDQRVRLVLDDSRATFVVTQGQYAHRFAGLASVCLEPDWAATAGYPDTAPEVDLSPDNLAYLMYTSGSTGQPKGAQICHRGIVRLVHATDYCAFDEHQTFLLHSPLAFDAATFELWGALCNGGRLAVCPPGTPTAEELENLLRHHEVTTLCLATALFHHVADVRPAALSTLRYLVVGGDVLNPAHVRTVNELGVEINNAYGPTECTTFSTIHRGASPGDKVIPIGPPIPHTDVLVVDEELLPVPFGVPGELLIGGPGMARGYAAHPSMTAERFVPDPRGHGRMYRSGDIVRQDPDGLIHFVGRRDHQVKIRGHRVELGEVETAIAALPGVRDGAAAVQRGADGTKFLVGYAALEDGVALDGLADLMRDRVPSFLVPTAWIELDAMPINANGKLDRKALPAAGTASSARAYVAPRNSTERALTRTWGAVLGVERVGVHDDFFALGGHSLLILRIIAVLRERHAIDLTVRAFMEHRTVERLAASITGAPTAAKALIWLNRTGSRAPLFCVHPGGGSAHWYLRVAEELDPELPLAAFEWPGLQSPTGPAPSTEDMATRYLAELRAAVPHGPYRLFGWCGGSGIASEIAHRLTADGEQVTFMLLDPGIDSHDRVELQDEFTLIKRCVELLERLDAGDSSVREETLALLNHIVDDVDPEIGITLPEHGAGEMWLPAARVWREVMELCLTYRHRRYDGPLHLIVSDELAKGEHEVAAGQTYREFLARWQEMTGGVRVHRLPGDHFSVMKAPHVGRLAALLDQVIAADEARENQAR
ncbi:FIG01294969: hypothetical protein [Alloactinosynnema sp. L-07]|uniref:amino acid adenylation domain-containing protein n=1 Tax=Alloactinosynnema sp. L-07 TaxID=1653480 RepID=UPI00065EF218|nr:non-ribosomal peptide synthetase [Alloactinosynnema sp. L-07]CRK57276.1 FIG01294969: hypothetical protein [Alloactinosynnema sp. L-07]